MRCRFIKMHNHCNQQLPVGSAQVVLSCLYPFLHPFRVIGSIFLHAPRAKIFRAGRAENLPGKHRIFTNGLLADFLTNCGNDVTGLLNDDNRFAWISIGDGITLKMMTCNIANGSPALDFGGTNDGKAHAFFLRDDRGMMVRTQQFQPARG